MKEQSTATKEINRLHFHFSGHGVYNAKVLLEDSKKLKTETEETETPNGNCIVGTTGELFSVHDLKVKLLGNALKPRVETRGSKVTVKTITITLDCCNELRRRDLRGESEEKPKPKERQLKLKHQDIISISDQMKIAVMNCAPEGHYVHDNDSFTKKLSAVTKKGAKSLSISELIREVNEIWNEDAKACQLAHIDSYGWKNFYWPCSAKTNHTIQTQQKEMAKQMWKHTL